MDHAGPIALSTSALDPGQAAFDAVRPVAGSEAAASGDPRFRAWAEQAANGDSEAFGALVEACQDRLHRFLLRMTHNATDAEDLAQDTLIKAYVALRRGPVPESFFAWLFTIARRTASNHRRDQRPWEPLDEAAAETAADDPAAAAGGQIWRLARRLPPRQYETLWLRYGEGFSVAEVARITGATQIGTKVMLHRARRKLAGWLTRENRAAPTVIGRNS
jgi:RNA polymerase sigma-70 factor (ECF subfamily)